MSIKRTQFLRGKSKTILPIDCLRRAWKKTTQSSKMNQPIPCMLLIMRKCTTRFITNIVFYCYHLSWYFLSVKTLILNRLNQIKSGINSWSLPLNGHLGNSYTIPDCTFHLYTQTRWLEVQLSLPNSQNILVIPFEATIDTQTTTDRPEWSNCFWFASTATTGKQNCPNQCANRCQCFSVFT